MLNTLEAKSDTNMKLADRPLVLLLSILDDNKPKTLKEMTLKFQELLGEISKGVFRPDELKWLDSVEMVLEHLQQKGLIVLVDLESYKYQITVSGRHFFEKRKIEMGGYLSIELWF